MLASYPNLIPSDDIKKRIDMKKTMRFILPLFGIFLFSIDALADIKTGKSYMYPRPLYYNIFAEKELWHDILHDPQKNHFQIVPIYQKSMASDKVKKYFLFDKKTDLLVTGDLNATSTGSPIHDVWAGWLEINNTQFSGNLSINPLQKQYGGLFEYALDLKDLFSCSLLKPFWLGVLVPLVYVKNNINLSQSNVTNKGTSDPEDIIQGFQRGDLLYSRMDGEHSRFGIPEIVLKFGAKYASGKDGFQINATTNFLIPTVSEPNPKYLFTPILGNEKHVGFGADVDFQVPLTASFHKMQIMWFLDVIETWFLRKSNYRTLDLYGKPWSRYMLVWKPTDTGTEAIPATNILTIKVKSKPYNFVDFSTGLRFKQGSFELSVGYGVWAHATERLELHEDAFSTLYGIKGSTPGASASNSSIDHKSSDDATFTFITQYDLDLESAAAQSAVVQKANASFGWVFDRKKASFGIGFGAFVDIPNRNTALPNWGLWGKASVAF